MRIVSRKKLKDFWINHADIREPLQAWYADVKKAKWKSPTDIKNVYSNASIITNNRVVFNIKGNKYRLVVAINYGHSIVYIRFIGSHKEYDQVDVSTIQEVNYSGNKTYQNKKRLSSRPQKNRSPV